MHVAIFGPQNPQLSGAAENHLAEPQLLILPAAPDTSHHPMLGS